MDTTFLNQKELKLLEFVKEKHGEQKRIEGAKKGCETRRKMKEQNANI